MLGNCQRRNIRCSFKELEGEYLERRQGEGEMGRRKEKQEEQELNLEALNLYFCTEWETFSGTFTSVPFTCLGTRHVASP